MLTIVSHELRSPLHGIIGITDTLKKSATESKQKRQLRIISDCAKRLLDFVSTMMDLTAMQKHTEFALNNDPVRPGRAAAHSTLDSTRLDIRIKSQKNMTVTVGRNFVFF